MDWFYALGGQQAGPISETQFLDLSRRGVILPDTLVWHAGMAEWLPFSVATAGFQVSSQACSSCGNRFPVSDLAFFGDAAVCASCKPVWVQRFAQGMATSAAPPVEYAGFWIRLVAYLIDGIILTIVRYAITLPLSIEKFAGTRPGANPFFSTAQLIEYGMQLAYVVYFWTSSGSTPGKMIFHLKVVNPDGSTISPGQAIGRFFGYILSSVVLLIGFMMIGWDSEKRGLHDRVCGTRVIRTW